MTCLSCISVRLKGGLVVPRSALSDVCRGVGCVPESGLAQKTQ